MKLNKILGLPTRKTGENTVVRTNKRVGEILHADCSSSNNNPYEDINNELIKYVTIIRNDKNNTVGVSYTGLRSGFSYTRG